MSNVMKKLCFMAVALIFVSAIVFAFPLSFSAKAETSAKTIDMYLIAGQSNAAGQSYATNVSGTFDNVLYAGETNYYWSSGSASSRYMTYPYISVKSGLGTDGSYIGPEFGMAKYLNGLYNSDNKALIFKSAAGGVSLCNETPSDADANHGNWYPDRTGTSFKGGQYRRFIQNFSSVVDDLRANGYEPVVKAFIWMQGEADIWGTNATRYTSVFTEFCRSMREDLGEKLNKTNDEMLDMPYIVGEISPTGGYGRSSYDRATNEAFIRIQRGFPDVIPNVKVVKSSAFDTDIANNNVWHWSGEDMVTIGEMFARAAVGDETYDIVSLDKMENGSVVAAFNEDRTAIEFTVTPNRGYKLGTLKINGADVTAEAADLKYSVNYQTGDEFSVELKCVALAKYDVSYFYQKNLAYIDGPDYVYEGEILSLKITLRTDATVASVTLNGTEMPYNSESGAYESAVTDDCEVRITFNKVNADENQTASSDGEQTENDGEKGKGCSGSDAVLVLSILGAVAAAAVILRK